MIDSIDASQAEWEVKSNEDPDFAHCVRGLVLATAMLGEHRNITVVHIDRWFGDFRVFLSGLANSLTA